MEVASLVVARAVAAGVAVTLAAMAAGVVVTLAAMATKRKETATAVSMAPASRVGVAGRAQRVTKKHKT